MVSVGKMVSNIKFVFVIIICISIIGFVVYSQLPDNRELKNQNYEQTNKFGGIEYKIDNVKNNAEEKFIQFDVELITYNQRYVMANQNEFTKVKISDSENDIYDTYYKDTIKNRINNKGEKIEYLVRTYEISYDKKLKDIYYFDVQGIIYENLENKETRKFYDKEVESTNVNLDYRLVKEDDVESIKNQSESEEVEDFKSKLKYKSFTKEGLISDEGEIENIDNASTTDDNPDETETLTSKEINEINKTNKEEKILENTEKIKEYQDKINGLNNTMKDLNMQGDDKEKTQEVINSYKEEIQKLEAENKRINDRN